jgi:hypothetical protein
LQQQQAAAAAALGPKNFMVADIGIQKGIFAVKVPEDLSTVTISPYFDCHHSYRIAIPGSQTRRGGA